MANDPIHQFQIQDLAGPFHIGGYEISFTRYFYKPPQLRTLAEIRADIEALERETEGLLEEIVGVSGEEARA